MHFDLNRLNILNKTGLCVLIIGSRLLTFLCVKSALGVGSPMLNESLSFKHFSEMAKDNC